MTQESLFHVAPISMWVAPTHQNSRTSSQRGARWLAKANIAPTPSFEKIGAAIEDAAAKWGRKAAFCSRYSFEDRCWIALCAILLNIERVKSARNPGAMAFRIAERALRKTFRDEFPHSKRVSGFVPLDGTEPADGAANALAPSGSPNAWSAYTSEQQLEAWWNDVVSKIPTALLSLCQTEREIAGMYYGLGGIAELKSPAIASLKGISVRMVSWHLQKALMKLRKFFGISPAKKPENS